MTATLKRYLPGFITWLRGIFQLFINLNKGDIFYGLRMAVMLLIPIAIAILFKRESLGAPCLLGSMFTALADPGGSYRGRARAMLLGACLFVASCLIATQVGDKPFWLVILIFLWTFSAGMFKLFGPVASRLSSVAIVSFIILMSRPTDLFTTLLQCSLILLGALWTMAFFLWSWPIRPFQPTRDSVANYYRVLRALSLRMRTCEKGFNTGDTNGGEELWQYRIKVHQVRNRAFRVVRESSGHAHPVSQQMQLLLAKADQILAARITLFEGIKAISLKHQLAAQYTMDQALIVVDRNFLSIIEAIQHDQPMSETIDYTLQEFAEHLHSLQQLPLENHDPAISNANLVLRMLQQLIFVFQGTTIIFRGSDFTQTHDGERQKLSSRFLKAWHLIIENMTLGSPVFRHALRLSIIVTLATALYKFLHIPLGYWIPLAAMVILRPDFLTTWQRVQYRVGGTFAGGIVTVVIAALVYNKLILSLLMVTFILLAFASRSRHYGLYAFFITPFVVLSIDIVHLGNWITALIRIANNFAGGLLALTALYLFRPRWEGLSHQIAKTLSANLSLFRAIWSSYLSIPISPKDLDLLIQQAHNECINATMALESLGNDPQLKQDYLAEYKRLVEYNQILCNIITALSTQCSPSPSLHALQCISSIADQFEENLQSIQAVVHTHKEPGSIQKLEESIITGQNLLL